MSLRSSYRSTASVSKRSLGNSNLHGVQWRFLRDVSGEPEYPAFLDPGPDAAEKTLAEHFATGCPYSPQRVQADSVQDSARAYIDAITDLELNSGRGEREDVDGPGFSLRGRRRTRPDSALSMHGSISRAALKKVDRLLGNAADEFSEQIESQGSQSRSPSPVIIWRPSARVRVVDRDELPSGLKSVFKVPQKKKKRPKRKAPPSAAALGGAAFALAGPDAGAGAAFKNPQPWRTSLSDRDKGKRSKMHYGDWFVPVDHWKVEYRSTDKKDGDAEANQRWQNKKNKKKLESLYITKAYKKYVEAQQGKLPHYMAGVDAD